MDQLDQPIYLILGAGLLLCIIAFFFGKRGTKNQNEEIQALLLQRKQERAEMEKSIQRFVQQVKQENELVVANLRKTKENLRSDLDQLETRIQELEAELASVQTRLAAVQNPSMQSVQPAVAEKPAAEVQEDTLFLRKRFQKAFDLRKEGKSIDEIAKELGAGRGEMELIFSLASPQERGESHG